MNWVLFQSSLHTWSDRRFFKHFHLPRATLWDLVERVRQPYEVALDAAVAAMPCSVRATNKAKLTPVEDAVLSCCTS